MGLKQDAWEAILSTYDLERSQRVSPTISSDEIKEATGGKEPRLVCSMDSRDSVPEVLSEQDLFVLPVQNGVYRLVEGDGYADLPDIPGTPDTWENSLSFDLSTKGGAGEDPHLLYSYNTGLLSEFTGIDSLYPTSVGRKRCNRFSFQVGDSREITAEGVQFQVDGLFEGQEAVSIVEAKSGSRDDFIIRQLYYPYRHYMEEVPKEVRTFFFVYDEPSDTYNFWDYRFQDPEDYSSIELVNSEKFRIAPVEPDLETFSGVERREEMGWKGPQADSVEKLMELPFLVRRGLRGSQALADHWDVHRRQGNYYSKAVEENLGLIDRSGGDYSLTDLGEEYVNSRPDERHELLARQMLQDPIMNTVLKRLVSRLGEDRPYVTKQDIADLLKEKAGLTGTTLGRRAQTVVAWFRWISEHVGLVRVEGNRIQLALGSPAS